MNWLILIPLGIVVIALPVFVFKRNQEDEKEFEHQLNGNLHQLKHEEGDIDAEEKTKYHLQEKEGEKGIIAELSSNLSSSIG